MHLAAITMLGAQGANARLLAGAGALRAPAALLRAQPGSHATALGADGTTWASFAADAPRFAGTAADLLLEGARTNLVTHPRTPGSTGWTNTGIASAVGATGPDGASSAFLLTESTATSLHAAYIGNVTVALGTRYVGSALVAAGTASLVQLAFSTSGFGTTQFANFILTGEGSLGTVGAGIVAQGIERSGDFYRVWMAADATAAVATAGFNIFFITSSTSARAPSFAGTSRTLRLAWPQMEAGSAPTTPILPPAGAPAAATRGAEQLTVPLADLAIGETGAGIYEATVVMPQPAPAGAAQSILEIEADANDRYILRVAAGGSSVAVNRVTAGVAAGDVAAGTMTPGQPFTVRLTLPGDGTARLSVDGGAEVSVTGGPVTRLATLRIGNNAAGTAPMNGRLRRLLVQPGRDPLRLGIPDGFGWTPPFSLYRAADGSYRHNFAAAPYIRTGKAYYLSPAGSDTNDGLTVGTPRRSLWRILQDVTDYDVIYLAAGEYDGTTGWAGRTMARAASLIAVGGRAVVSRRATGTAWAADPNPGVWVGTPPSATPIGLVTDARFPDANGQPQRLLRVASIAACAATAGSFFASGTIVHVRTQDSRQPDADVAALYASPNAVLAGNVDAYFKDIDFVGGDDAFRSTAATFSRTVVFDGCTFRFASGGDGLDLDCAGDVFLLNCVAELNELDGFNYAAATSGGGAPRVAELGCIARWNGWTTSGFNNGTTLHDGATAVTLGGVVERNQNRNVHDVRSARRWMLGTTVRDSRATDASGCNYVVGQIPGQTGEGVACQLWLDGCLSSGSVNDLVVNAAGTARRRNTDTAAWGISNAGTFGTY